MLKYLFLCFSLFTPVKISSLKDSKIFHSYDTQIACMVPPPGDIPSKMANSAATPAQGCRTSSQTRHHRDGSSTEHLTISCSKKIKRDKHGNVIKETDTSQPRYQSAQKAFFSSASKGASSSNKK